MNDVSEQNRAELVALLDQALRDEGRTEPPTQAEAGDWLCDDSKLSEPDENGWMTRVPIEPRWSPRALVFWRMVALSDVPIAEELRRDPRYSLARWPEVDAAVRPHLHVAPCEALLSVPPPKPGSGALACG